MKSVRPFALSVGLVAILSGGALPASVGAAEICYRFEENATANWRVVEQCSDATTSTTLVTVSGGLEFESPDLTDVNQFVTLRVRNFATCDGVFINDFGTGQAQYEGSE